MQHGFLLINKPAGWTSHDVVGYLRKITRIKKIGHAGTLDPFATGLLIVGVGREATKQLEQFKQMKKVYQATLQLGATSDTYDSTGNIRESCITNHVSCNMYHVSHIKSPQLIHDTCYMIHEKKIHDIKEVLASFIGEQMQIPPMYSAKKVRGQKLYSLARQGIEIERQPHSITIYKIKLLKFTGLIPSPTRGGSGRDLTIQITCSPGTYIRTLAYDIGQKLGCGAYCQELTRTAIGKYTLKKALEPQKITHENWESFLFTTKNPT